MPCHVLRNVIDLGQAVQKRVFCIFLDCGEKLFTLLDN